MILLKQTKWKTNIDISMLDEVKQLRIDGHLDQALEQLTRLSNNADPARLALRVKIARELQEHGRLDEAQEIYLDIQRREPSHLWAVIGHAQICSNRGLHDQAIELYFQAIQHHPSAHHARIAAATELRAVGRLDDAVQQLESILESKPEHQHALVLKANILQQQGKIPEALSIYRVLLDDDERFQPAIIGASRAYADLGDINNAIDLLDRACKRSWVETWPFQMRARMLRRSGASDAARSDLLHAHSLAPGDPDVMQQLVRFSLHANDLADAQRWLDALKNAQGTSAIRYSLETTLLMRQGNFAEAERIVDEGRARHPNDDDLLISGMRLAVRISDHERALSLIASRRDTQAPSSTLLVLHADVLERLGRITEADACWQHVTASRPPPNIFSLQTLSECCAHVRYLLRQHRYDAALSTFQSLYVQTRWNPDILHVALEIGSHGDRYESAETGLDRWMAEYPDEFRQLKTGTPLFSALHRYFESVGDALQTSRLERTFNTLQSHLGDHPLLPIFNSILHRAQGLTEQARILCNSAIATHPEHADQYQLEIAQLDWNSMDTVQCSNRALKATGSSSECREKALQTFYKAAIRGGGEQSARSRLEQEIEENPGNVSAYENLAHLLVGYYRDANALIALAHAAKEKQVPGRGLYVYAALEAAQHQRYDEALLFQGHAQRMRPLDNFVAGAKANVLRAMSRHSEALQVVNDLLSKEEFASLLPGDSTCPLTVDRLGCGSLSCAETRGTVSVIMTTFRRDPLLEYALRSILNQTYQDLEVILVDDSSPDDNYEYACALARSDPRVQVLRTERNVGTYCAKNLGLKHARGKYIACMDSDDWLHPQALERQIETLINTELMGVMTGFFRVLPDSRIEYFPEAPMGWAHITLCFRREPVFERLGYFDSVRTGADTEYFNRIRYVFGPRAVDWIRAPLLISTRHENSITGGGHLQFSWWGPSEVDRAYFLSSRTWHRRIVDGSCPPYLSDQPERRPFPVDNRLLP